MSTDSNSHSEAQVEFRDAVFATVKRRFEEAKSKGVRFVHYTSASNAIRILGNREVTLRSAPFMNDFSEIRYGERLVWDSITRTQRFRFETVLDSLSMGLPLVTLRYFEAYGRLRALETYMLCISEHGNGLVNEDLHGRLSMWRAYGGDTNVALVLNGEPLLRDSDALRAYSFPVRYEDASSFSDLMEAWINDVEAISEIARALPMEELARQLGFFLHVLTISTKHPGFAEEREWRVVYEPSLQRSNHISEDYVQINGIPQRVFKIKLKNIPDEGLTGIEPNELFNRLIIGPSPYPWPMREAFIKALTDAGVQRADEKVWVSEIPIRR